MMKSKAALITAPEPAAIAVIQMRGEHSLSILQTVFHPKQAGALSTVRPDQVFLGHIQDGPEIIDEVLVRADTGQGLAEIHCHGGPRVVQRILMTLQKNGAEIAEWESLFDAPSIAAEISRTLPRMQSRLGVLAIAAQQPGGLTGWCEKQIQRLKDNPKSLEAFREEAKHVLASYELARKLILSSRVVLCGPTNAGKSTLANALTGWEQSMIAELPGTTRDWTEQTVELEGIPVTVVDTAGWKTADNAIEQDAMIQTAKQMERADLIVLVLEASREYHKRRETLVRDLPTGKAAVIAVNKIDLHPSMHVEKGDAGVSALKEKNLDSLRRAITEGLGFSEFQPEAPLVFTERQKNLLEEAISCKDSDAVIRILQRIISEMK